MAILNLEASSQLSTCNTPPIPVKQCDSAVPPDSPARPPSPMAKETEILPPPVPVPPQESISASTYRRTTFRVPSASPSSAHDSSSSLSSALPSSFPSRNGSPAWARRTSTWTWATSTLDRSRELPLYTGKENCAITRGAFGPGMYEVRCSTTGSPLKLKRSPRFAGNERFNRQKCYEGKENSETMRGAFGPGMYDVKCSRTGSPLKLKHSPRFAGNERFNREKQYAGKAAEQRGQAGASGLNSPRCSNRGSPLWKSKPSAAFAMPYVPKLRHEVLSARSLE